jgi:hypothetical protein
MKWLRSAKAGDCTIAAPAREKSSRARSSIGKGSCRSQTRWLASSEGAKEGQGVRMIRQLSDVAAKAGTAGRRGQDAA